MKARKQKSAPTRFMEVESESENCKWVD